MKILFIHQNFPGQFKFLAPALAEQGHNVFALAVGDKPARWKGVQVIAYKPDRFTSKDVHPWLSDFETKVIRGEAVYRKLTAMKERGLEPDLIIAHHGWGETLFIKHVWPSAKVGIYCEFHYSAKGLDIGFDPEFPANVDAECKMQMRNLNNQMHFDIADAAISPTKFQSSTFPEQFQRKISVIHDGIDTHALRPDPEAVYKLENEILLDGDAEVITFVNRNFEPYRGYHIFMRALPKLLEDRPKLRVLMIGGDDVSYGSAPADGSWKERFIQEVKSQISEENWQRVHFLGLLTYAQYVEAMKVSSLHVYLTYPFVLSWSLLEAMSLGVPIVGSDTEPVREVIKDGTTGRLVDFFSVDHLAATVTNLLDDDDERARLSSNALEFVRNNFDLHDVCLPGQLKWVEKLSAGLLH